jgi:hypothetical protein
MRRRERLGLFIFDRMRKLDVVILGARHATFRFYQLLSARVRVQITRHHELGGPPKSCHSGNLIRIL